MRAINQNHALVSYFDQPTFIMAQKYRFQKIPWLQFLYLKVVAQGKPVADSQNNGCRCAWSLNSLNTLPCKKGHHQRKSRMFTLKIKVYSKGTFCFGLKLLHVLVLFDQQSIDAFQELSSFSVTSEKSNSNLIIFFPF